MTTFSRNGIRAAGAALVLLGIGGAVLLLTGNLHISNPGAIPQAAPTIDAHGNSGVITEGQTGGTNTVR